MRAYTQLSPIDEVHHYDSMLKWSRGDVVHRGDDLGRTAWQASTCRAIDAPGMPPPRCATDAELRTLRDENVAYMHPPL